MNIATHTEAAISNIGQAITEGRWADVLANVAADVVDFWA